MTATSRERGASARPDQKPRIRRYYDLLWDKQPMWVCYTIEPDPDGDPVKMYGASVAGPEEAYRHWERHRAWQLEQWRTQRGAPSASLLLWQ